MNLPIKVFIDTNIIIATGFNFSGGHLKSLRDMCLDGHVELFTSFIVEQEIRNHIRTDVMESLKKIRNTIKKERSLAGARNIDSYSFLFKDIRNEGIVETIENQFDAFLSDTKCRIIEISDVDSQMIFMQYFGKLPPFGSGGKKSEFPDAFAIASLLNYSEMNEMKIHVLSDDHDWEKSLFDKCIVFKNINELLNIINNSIAEKEELISKITEECKTLSFLHKHKMDLEVDIFDADVSLDYTVDYVEIIEVDVKYINLISINYFEDNIAKTTFDVNCEIVIESSYMDEEMSIWDSEEKEYVFEFVEELQERHYVTFELDIDLVLNEALNEDIIYAIKTDDESPIIIELDEYTRISTLSQDEQDELNYRMSIEPFTCPDCGNSYGAENDGGNGVCNKCSSNH